MVRVAFFSVLGASLALGGCRSCDAPSAAKPLDASELRIAHHVKGGPFTELQVARAGDRADRVDFEHWRDDSSFVPLAAMTLLHEAFARALPGFDLFLPRLFGGEALAKLAAELEAFAANAKGDIVATAREIATLARATSAKGDALWVLGI